MHTVSDAASRGSAARRALTTGVVVAGSSLVSRVLALALLVPAARCLTVHDFGAFVLVVGVSVAVTGVLGSAVGDLIASGAVLHPVRTWRRTALGTAALGASGLLGAAAVTVARGDTGTWLTAALLTTTGLAPFIAMHLLRGSGHSEFGACLAFVVFPAVRLGSVVVLVVAGGGDLPGILTGLLWAGIACAVLSFAVVWCNRPRGARNDLTDAPIAATPPLAVAAGLSVAITFMTMGQAAPVSVTAFLGESATGSLAPTARVCETLTAVGVGYQFAASRRAVDGRSPQVPVRVVCLLAASFAVAALLVALIAPMALPALLGPGHDLNTAVAMTLVPAYFCTMLSAAEIQRLFLVSRYRRILLASVVATVTAAASVPTSTVLLGLDGAGGATAVSALTWWVMLRVRARASVDPDMTRKAVTTP